MITFLACTVTLLPPNITSRGTELPPPRDSRIYTTRYCIVCSCAVQNCAAPGLEKRGRSRVSNVCIIFHKQFATFSKLPPLAGVSQTCYSQANCTGDVVEAPGPTVKDCCVGANDGQSFADSSGTCIEDQCVGKRMFSIPNVHSYIIIIMLPLFY